MTPAVLVLVAAGGLSAPVPAEARQPGRALAALERKLHGEWVGRGPCDGRLTVRADGTFEWRARGPGGDTTAGTWAVKWDALPPTLVLTGKEPNDPAAAVRTEAVRLVRLDAEALAVTHPDGPTPPRPRRFSRAKE
jgi:hypothetical protein